jgi:hypothetical protein
MPEAGIPSLDRIMRDSGFDLPRISLPRTPVNRVEKKGQGY